MRQESKVFAPPLSQGRGGVTTRYGVKLLLRGLAPLLLVFIASACIMIIELVAGRIIARHVGSSLYTWTSIIGVVLAGISLGNYLGGVLADRIPSARARRFMSWQFLLSALLSLSVLWVHWLVFEAPFLADFSWPLRILTGVTLTFFAPALVLGSISPVVAKWALEQSRTLGKTIGSLYAWGSLGAIVGTLLTGFVLISHLGTSAVIALVALLLAALALLIHPSRSSLVGLALVTLLTWFAAAPWGTGVASKFQPRHLTDGDTVVFADESAYQTIRIDENPRGFFTVTLDDLRHGYVDAGDPTHLAYEYLQIYDLVMRHGPDRTEDASTFLLGGGAYTFPRYLAHRYPESEIVVAEIDEAVTRANQLATSLAAEPPFTIMHLDARQAAKELLRAGRSFDVIFTDAFRDFSVPYHLTTREFIQELHALSSEHGMIVSNVIDTFRVGRFLGAYVNTVASVFDHVYVFSTYIPDDGPYRDTFVVVGSKAPLHLGSLLEEIADRELSFHLLDRSEMATLYERSGGVVLSDDYAPVENMLSIWQRTDY